MSFTSYEVDNDKKFHAAIVRAKMVTDDLRVPLTLIAKDFYKSEKTIFMLQGPGAYPDFKKDDSGRSRYAEFKLNKYGFVYPLLMAKGRLAGSVTDPSHPDAINEIVNKRTLIIGSKVPYGVYHQSDRPRRKIPLRKFLFIGPESTFATSDQQGRVGRWLNIMNSFVLKKLGEPA